MRTWRDRVLKPIKGWWWIQIFEDMPELCIQRNITIALPKYKWALELPFPRTHRWEEKQK